MRRTVRQASWQGMRQKPRESQEQGRVKAGTQNSGDITGVTAETPALKRQAKRNRNEVRNVQSWIGMTITVVILSSNY